MPNYWWPSRRRRLTSASSVSEIAMGETAREYEHIVPGDGREAR